MMARLGSAAERTRPDGMALQTFDNRFPDVLARPRCIVAGVGYTVLRAAAISTRVRDGIGRVHPGTVVVRRDHKLVVEGERLDAWGSLRVRGRVGKAPAEGGLHREGQLLHPLPQDRRITVLRVDPVGQGHGSVAEESHRDEFGPSSVRQLR